MSLNDEEFINLMTAAPGQPASDFYNEYVRSIQAAVSQNADNEFETIWNEHEKSKKAYTLYVLSFL
jgi:glutamate dehydrogenase